MFTFPNRGYTYRYLFPGFLGFGLFVIFPIVYMVFLSFTKYSSQNLLYFDRSLALLRQETFSVGNISYKYKLVFFRRMENISSIWKARTTPPNASLPNRSN